MPDFADLGVAAWYGANLHTWAALLVGINLKLQIEGLENIPRKGPLIMASNHVSVADPPILCVKTPRRIAWMAKKELFDIPVVGLCYRFYGCVPVRRGAADLTALRQSEQALRKGLVLGMFPEGTRSRQPGMKTAEPGTALIALRTGVPVLPVALSGTEAVTLPHSFFHWLRRDQPSIRLVYGRPFRLPQSERIRREEVEQGTREIMAHIAELLPRDYRGAYADTVPSAAAEPVQ
ncbi:MAG TPA: lysophospholipid acyltransferase family protein [Dehalococcoidia bacterium]|nr:lysophospholipid acyltransferase family protein [Dehalococcoidia bacterium]